MRVLHILHHSLPLLSGYSIRSSYIVNLQRVSGIETAVVTSGQHPNGDEVREFIDATEYRRTRRQTADLPFMRERSLMANLERQVESAAVEFLPDIIHAHSPVLVGLPALRVSQRLGIPMVYEIRDLWENASVDRGKFSTNSVSYRIARGFESYVLKRADAIVTICEGLRHALVPRVAHGETVHVVGNGVDIDFFQPKDPNQQLRARWGLEGKEVVLYAGTFQPYEGLDLLVRATRELLRERPQAHLVIVGGSQGLSGVQGARSTEEEHLHSVVGECSLGDHVTFTGRIPHGEVREMYALADVLVYPRRLTRTTALTTPLKPLEAMAMAKPVVASDVPAMRELVSDDITGLLFKAGDYRDLAIKCGALLSDSSRRRRMGLAGREVVVRSRTWAGLVSKYLPLYQSLIDQPQAGPQESACAGGMR